jgi:hypothetical protein
MGRSYLKLTAGANKSASVRESFIFFGAELGRQVLMLVTVDFFNWYLCVPLNGKPRNKTP